MTTRKALLVALVALCSLVSVGCRRPTVLVIKGGPTPPSGEVPVASGPIGTWSYASGESEGSSTDVYGTLVISPDGTFSDERTIAGIGGFRDGTYQVQGNQLILTFDGGANSQTYAYSLSQAADADGVVFDTLLLQGDGLSFILTRQA